MAKPLVYDKAKLIKLTYEQMYELRDMVDKANAYIRNMYGKEQYKTLRFNPSSYIRVCTFSTQYPDKFKIIELTRKEGK